MDLTDIKKSMNDNEFNSEHHWIDVCEYGKIKKHSNKMKKCNPKTVVKLKESKKRTNTPDIIVEINNAKNALKKKVINEYGERVCCNIEKFTVPNQWNLMYELTKPTEKGIAENISFFNFKEFKKAYDYVYEKCPYSNKEQWVMKEGIKFDESRFNDEKYTAEIYGDKKTDIVQNYGLHVIKDIFQRGKANACISVIKLILNFSHFWNFVYIFSLYKTLYDKFKDIQQPREIFSIYGSNLDLIASESYILKGNPLTLSLKSLSRFYSDDELDKINKMFKVKKLFI